MKYKILAIFANHTNNKTKYNISLNNLSLIFPFVSNIIIIDSQGEYYANCLKKDLNNTKILDYFFYKNDHYYDFGKWISVLEKTNFDNFDYVLFINDSIILTKAIEKFFDYIENIITPNINLYAYNDSTQIRYHYQSYLFLIKRNIIDKFYHFFENKRHLVHNLDSLVKNIELNMCDIDENHDVFLKIGNEYNFERNLYWENEDLYKYLINKNIFAIIKYKKIIDIQKEHKISIHGHSISDFDVEFYKEYYDFNNLSNKEALDHFINYGQYEGRKQNKFFNVILPKYYRKKLNELGILYLFDVPSDFDIYYYKKNNVDIDHLSIIDSIFHYINNGYYEGRIYNKTTDKNSYLNNYYLKILSSFENINDIILPENFNLQAVILLNNFLDKFEYYGCLKEYLNNNNIFYEKKLLGELLENVNINKYKNSNKLDNLDNLHVIQHYINNKDTSSLNIPSDFNHENYRNIYKDLIKYSNKELEQHYVLHGIRENRIYKLPKDFNPEKYKQIYSDLTNLNNEELINHYLFNGINEKRTYKIPHDFNPTMYKKIYKDLENLNDKELVQHYAFNGIKENRIYKLPDDFNVNTYKKIYKDLESLDNNSVAEHYLTIGIFENRTYKLPNDFDPLLYKKIYSDLSQLNNNSLIEHYLSLGIREGRVYKLPDDFDPKLFKKLYKSLAYLTDENVIEHYLIHGIRDNLQYKLPNDFNTNTYKLIYKDLSQLNDDQLINHYIEYGLNEGRKYKIPDDFNPEIYKKIYKDLNDLNSDDLRKHYLNFGISEQRYYKVPDDFNCDLFKQIYPELSNLADNILKDYFINNVISKNLIYKIPNDFNPAIYRKIHKDLDQLNDEQLKNHYLEKGITEKRIYKLSDDFDPIVYKNIYSDLKKLNKQQLIDHYLYNGINENRIYKLPSDFNPNIYKELNKDLSNLNDEQLKNHYLYNGVNEKRIYK